MSIAKAFFAAISVTLASQAHAANFNIDQPNTNDPIQGDAEQVSPAKRVSLIPCWKRETAFIGPFLFDINRMQLLEYTQSPFYPAAIETLKFKKKEILAYLRHLDKVGLESPFLRSRPASLIAELSKPEPNFDIVLENLILMTGSGAENFFQMIYLAEVPNLTALFEKITWIHIKNPKINPEYKDAVNMLKGYSQEIAAVLEKAAETNDGVVQSIIIRVKNELQKIEPNFENVLTDLIMVTTSGGRAFQSLKTAAGDCAIKK